MAMAMERVRDPYIPVQIRRETGQIVNDDGQRGPGTEVQYSQYNTVWTSNRCALRWEGLGRPAVVRSRLR
jgi:hypothetical protein